MVRLLNNNLTNKANLLGCITSIFRIQELSRSTAA